MSNTPHSSMLKLEITAEKVAYLTLNRPEVHNAFDDELISQLLAALAQVRQADARLLVLAGKGKSFSAGADLGWMQRMASYSQAENQQDAQELARLMHELNTLPCLTIAKVQGAAFGGAVGLAACCDLVLATPHAKFCLSEVRIGLAPAVISPYVSQAIGARAMRRYALTAEVISAEKALELGLVSELLADEAQLDERLKQLIKQLLANSPQAVRLTKELVHYVAEKDLAQQESNTATQDYTTQLIAQIRVSPEGQEGLAAFFAKRSASWVNSDSNKTNSNKKV